MAATMLAKKERDFDPKKFLATIGEGTGQIISHHPTLGNE
jgi:hypothetical protein